MPGDFPGDATVLDIDYFPTQVVVQEDRTVFAQLLATTDLIGFTTDAPRHAAMPPGRVRVPIGDASARQTFFACCRSDSPESLRSIVDP